jgi:hypothetical protein
MTDHSTHIGAKALASRIEEYWAHRRQPVLCRLEPRPIYRKDGSLARTVWDIRSEMVNGVPR